ncbi:MAG: hypothetical protein LBD04_11785 [Synergistaceae bacterium]|jgi:hypothetical protein|nr:hypothetical protein [Synergistaceae bacterium]
MLRVTTKLSLVFFALLLIGALPVLGEESPLANMYVEYLKSEGYSPEVDKDGDVVFKYEGRTYYIGIDDDDPEFFIVVYPNFWEIESDAEKELALEIARKVTDTKKLAKVHLSGQGTNVSVRAGTLLKEPEDFKHVLPRMLNAIAIARQEFVKGMRGGD